MSFLRLIYWSSLIGGWSAFIAWLFTELIFGRWIDPNASTPFIATVLALLMSAMVASAISGGISVIATLANPHWLNVVKRVLPGLLGGFIGGLVGSLLGVLLFSCVGGIPFIGFIGRVIGWTLIGIGIGVIEGIYERSLKKIRNGLIGGGLGGFIGGVLFDPIAYVIGSSSSGRAFAFVVLGLAIGLFIGLVQVVLKEAWLTVEGGFRPGRQMILTQELVTMGTSEKSNLIFIAYGAKGVEPIHLRITKQKDGGYVLEDNQSRTGTLLNGEKVNGPTPLRDGDAIQFGVNVVRFNERVTHGQGGKGLPAPVIAAAPKPPSSVSAVTPSAAAVKPATPAPTPASPVQTKPSATKPAPIATSTQPAPKPAAKPAEPAKPQEGRCPICDKKIVGVPGERRCKECFITF